MSKKKQEELEKNIAAIREIVGDEVMVERMSAGKYRAGDRWFSTKGYHHDNYKPKEIKAPSQGLGDDVEKVLKATGIKKVVEMFTPEGKDCGCDKRKEKLNKMFPKNKPNCMNEEQYKAWGEAKADMEKNQTISPEVQALIVVLIREVHNMAIAPCGTCSASAWMRYINMLDKVYETYGEE